MENSIRCETQISISCHIYAYQWCQNLFFTLSHYINVIGSKPSLFGVILKYMDVQGILKSSL
jgi:hypothetical protein